MRTLHYPGSKPATLRTGATLATPTRRTRFPDGSAGGDGALYGWWLGAPQPAEHPLLSRREAAAVAVADGADRGQGADAGEGVGVADRRCAQYTSAQHARLPAAHGIRLSVGRRGR